MSYWAFISYSHHDEAWASWLQRAIERYRIPSKLVGCTTRSGPIPRRLFPVFRDRDELPTSSNLGENILRALQQSQYLIVICSPHSAQSRWVNEEVRIFKELGREDRVLCLIVGGEPNAADETQCFPHAVRHRLQTGESLEPLAADARPGKDRRDDAKLKILAGLLDVGFDELKEREKRRHRAGQAVAAAFAGLAAMALLLPDGPLPSMRRQLFDAYQVAFPRAPAQTFATLVAIDDRSLEEVGRWPWPRDVIARLVDLIAAAKPAAIAVDVIFGEPDETSPERVALRLKDREPALAAQLANLKSNDGILADSIARAPVVLAAYGPTGSSAPIAQRPGLYALAAAVDTELPIDSYSSVARSLPTIDQAARGVGIVSVSPDADGVFRRFPLIFRFAGTPVLSLAAEAGRVAATTSFQQQVPIRASGVFAGMARVSIGSTEILAEADGKVRPHFARNSFTVVSAADVLAGRHQPETLAVAVVLVGITARALGDLVRIPLGEFWPGVAVHAELVENIFAETLLVRPGWARWVESSIFLLVAVLYVLAGHTWSFRRSTVAIVLLAAALTCAGIVSFLAARLLFDPLHVMLGVAALFTVNMTYGYFSSSAR